MGEKIMKKTIFYLALAAAAVSCVKEQNPGVEAPEKTLVPMEFVACSEMTKTTLAEDGVSVEWIEGDQVAIFDGSNMNGDADEGQRFKAQSSGASVVLAGEADPAAEEYYAIYPFSSGHSLTNGVFTTQIKAQQTVNAGSMADDCAVVVGKAEAGSSEMVFKNVCSLVKFPLEVAGVKSLTLIGNNSEVIAGQFKLSWNDGDPQVTANSKPEVAVTLRDAEGADLVPGDYYFTILPTEFTEGFSVILGMNDGTQLIIRRGAVPALSRNQIFRTQNNIPAAAYKAHESNYVKYNDGFPLTYSHLTVQKGAEDAYAKYVNDGAPTVSADGVYFVGAEATTAVKSSVMACSKLVIAGDNPSVRSKINMTKALQPKTAEDGMIVCADLDITSALTDFITQGEKFTSFGDIVIYDCKLSTIQRALCRFIDVAMTLDNLVVEDSDILLNNGSETTSYMLNTNKMTSTINNIVYQNNVFHQTAETSKLTAFRFANCLNSTGSTIENVTITNNTLVGAYLSQHGFVRVNQLNGTVTITGNFFIESHPKDAEIGLLYVNEACGENMTYFVSNNIFYVSGATKKIVLADGKKATSSKPAEGTYAKLEGKTGTFNEVRSFTSYPLSENWNPAIGVFGYEADLTFGKLQSDGTVSGSTAVSAKWGAQRTTTPAAQNRAGYGYSSEELGNY